MGKQLLNEMSGATSTVSFQISRSGTPNSLRVPGLTVSQNNKGRSKSAEIVRRESLLSGTYSERTGRRSGSLNAKLRYHGNKNNELQTNSNYLQVPEITVSGTDGAESDSGSCSSRDRSPSPFDWIERENLPPGSPTFRRAMEEFLSESDLSAEECDNSDENGLKLDVPAKSNAKGQNNSSPRRSSVYKVVRHGKRVTVLRNNKR